MKMEEVFKDPVQLSKGINLKDLMSSEAEFHIDVDFKKKEQDAMVNIDNDLLSDGDDDSDTEDAYQNIEDSVSKLMLSSPEYHSFSELGAKMVDCVASGKVKMLILEEGDGPLIPIDAEVTIHYAAYWEKASIPFDSSLTMNSGAPVRLRLGSGRLLPGLEIGLTSVKGPTARLHLLLHPEATWGSRGAPPRIKAETSLFVVHLYGWTDTGAGHRFNDLPTTEQSKYEVTMKTVNSLHTIAKDLFVKGKFMKAIKNYQQSLSVLGVSEPKNENEEMDLKKLKINALVNLAVCYYKISKPKYVVITLENLDRIIDVETHCKALFYYGRAYEMLNKVDDAIVYYKKALKLEPKNKEIGRTLAALDAREKNAAKSEKEMWKNAFNTTEEKEKKEMKFSDIDVDFLSDVRDMCQDLAARTEYAKFDLTPGLTRSEVDCIKALVSDFEGLDVHIDGEGQRKKICIVRKLS